MPKFIVIGMGEFGYSIAKTLTDMGHKVLAIDTDEERVQEIINKIPNAVTADATDPKSLKALGADGYDVAVVSFGTNLEDRIMVTLALKEIGITHIIVKALNKKHGEVLRKIGADRIVFPEIDMGKELAISLTSPDIFKTITLSDEYQIVELSPPEDIVSKTIKIANIRAKYKLNIVGIRRGEGFIINPQSDEVIREGDFLVILGKNEDIEKFRKM